MHFEKNQGGKRELCPLLLFPLTSLFKMLGVEPEKSPKPKENGHSGNQDQASLWHSLSLAQCSPSIQELDLTILNMDQSNRRH
jgi:hypothetical protein